MVKASDKKTIIVTGIPGAGTKQFCERYKADTEGIGHNVQIYNAADYLLDASQRGPTFPPIGVKGILNMHPETLAAYRKTAFSNMYSDMKSRRNSQVDRHIIDMHAVMDWNKTTTLAWEYDTLHRFNADMYVSVIDKPSSVRANQRGTPHEAQNHGLDSLLYWMNNEVNMTEVFGQMTKKPVYILPVKQPGFTVESLLENYFLMYYQMSMTDATEEGYRRVSEFKAEIERLGAEINGLPTPIIDPRHIDIEPLDGLPQNEVDAINHQTTHRDLVWYIGKATDQVALYPEGAKLSVGVSQETMRGHETGNETFVIYKPKSDRIDARSPFFEISERVFDNDQQFLEFFPEYYARRLEELKRV